MEENKRSYSLEELETKTRRKLSESELKRQLSHDLANDPTFATVFNPPQIFSDEDNKTIVWTNNEPLRNGHWTNGYQPNHNMSNSAEHHNPRNSNGNVHNPNPNGISPNGDINSAGSGAGSRGSGSQSALLSVKRERHKWPKGKDFLFSTWAFVIGAHTLWELPVLTMRFGGVVFILIYLIIFLLIGTPMLLLEMTLGQYSALAPTKLYRNLCPVLTGVGFAICVSCMFQSMLDMSIITWSGQAFYLLFADPENSKNFEDFFYGKVLKLEDGSGLDNLGVLQGELSLCLGIACIVIFILIAAGTKSVGKVSILLVPTCYCLLMTLTIRGCMSPGGTDGIMRYLAPDWKHITQPWVWLEAAKVVFISMQLGMGVISTYASFNKYHHNIIRDAGIIAIGHFVWSILCVLFVFSLIGVVSESKVINADQFDNPKDIVSVTGTGIWLITSTLAESAIQGLDYKWLWSGLIYVLLVLTTAATVMGCMETLSACVVDEWPSMKPYKPAIVFTFLALLFMINLVMATQGGIYIYYLISVYYTQWPLIFFGLLTVLSAAFSHGGKYLMKDLSDMSKLALNHFINSHLSVLYTTLIPIFLCCSLGWCLYDIAGEHIEKPLKHYKMNLPDEWGMPLGWSLAFIPILIILGGLTFQMFWQCRGIPFRMHLKRSFKPTDVWYENEHRELMLLDSSAKESPILAFNRGRAYANRSSTEV